MKKDEVDHFLRARGWVEDRWGHFHKGEKRFKLQARKLRLERRVGNEWRRIASGFYKQLTIVNGELEGIKR